jgi:two-component system, NtrC family, sensor histidine kinase PilS
MSAGILLEKKPEKKSDIYQYDAPIYSSPKEKVWRLGVGRIFAILLLMTASWYWLGEQLPDSLNVFTRPPLVIFVVWLFLSLVYLAALNVKKYRLRQVTLQLVTDAVMVTWLVWATGDVRSPYITLYTVIICLTSIFFVARVTLWAAITSTVVFTTLMLLVMFEVVPRVVWDGGTVSAWRAVQIIAFHDVAFLVVGLLASQLAVRQQRSTVQLEETVQSLSNLQRLHERIVQSIRSGLVTTDLEGKIYTFNAAAEEITGHKSIEVRGWTIFDLLGDIQRPISETMMALDRGEQPPRLEIEFSKPDGGHVRLGWSVSPLFDETGSTTGLIITFQDLTEIRLMEESVRRKDRLAAVGRVAAGLAHEIRNPLGAMRGAIQVLQAGMDKDSSQAQLMDIVLRESDRLNTIITNFLGYARPRSGEFSEVDLADVINDSMTLLRHSPDVRKFHEIIEDMPKQPITAVVDAAGLKQVFWNLTRNAMQAMPNGGKLTVKLEAMPNNRAQITFNDTGKGMPQQQVERLFEPFSQSTTGGTGLGLSIVYQIIRDHNGTINVRSREGKGTTITIDLPTQKEEEKRRKTL